MKLAMITPSAIAHCTLCRWQWKAPTKKRKSQEPLTMEERFKVLEENILAHLRDAHGRILVHREELEPVEEGLMGKVYYHGRRPERVL